MGGPVTVVKDFVKDTSNTLTKITQPIEKAVTAGVQDTSKNLIPAELQGVLGNFMGGSGGTDILGGISKSVTDVLQPVEKVVNKVVDPVSKAVTEFVQDPSKATTNALQPVEKTINYIGAHPEMQLALAMAVAVPVVGEYIGAELMAAGTITSAEAAYSAAITAGATAAEAAAAAQAATATATIIGTAIASTSAQVAKGVPIEQAIQNTAADVAVSQLSPIASKQLDGLINSSAVKDAITSTVTSGAATAARGGSQADIEKAMTAGLAGSAASFAYKSVAQSAPDIYSKTIGGATAGAVTGGTEGAVVGGLSSAAGSLGSQLAKPTPKPADTAALPAEKVAATPSGGPTAEDLTKLAQESAKLIGPAEPPTASLNTGVVSDAGTEVQVAGAPYLAENAPENIKNLVPAGYRLLSSEESLPQNVKATLLPNGEYAFIGQDTSPEYLATQELPTETIPATQQVAGVDLTAPEVVSTTPEAAAIGIGGPAPDIAPEVAVTAPGAEDSATVVRVDPSTGNALVMNPSGEVFTITVDPSTKAGSTISVPASTTAPSTAPTSAPTSTPAPAPTTAPTTAPDFATTPTTTPAPEVAPTPAPSTDQPILDLIAERPTATDVAAPNDVPATLGKTPITEPPVAAPVTTTEPTPTPAPAPVEVDASIPRVEVSGVGNIPTEPAPVPEPEPAPIAPLPVSDRDREILNLINPEPVAPEPVTETPLAPEEPSAVAPELPAEDVSVEEAGSEPEQPVYDYDPKAKPKPDIFTTTYLSPKTRTAAAPTSALGSALGTTGLTSYRGAGEIEGAGTGKARRKVWNEESLKLKDALGV